MIYSTSKKDFTVAVLLFWWDDIKNAAMCLAIAAIIGCMVVMFYQGIVMVQAGHQLRLGRYQGMDAISYDVVSLRPRPWR